MQRGGSRRPNAAALMPAKVGAVPIRPGPLNVSRCPACEPVRLAGERALSRPGRGCAAAGRGSGSVASQVRRCIWAVVWGRELPSVAFLFAARWALWLDNYCGASSQGVETVPCRVWRCC